MYQPNQREKHFLTLYVATFNSESLLHRPISINSSWFNFMFLPPLSNTFNIHSHTYSLDFCLYKLEKACSSFGVWNTSTRNTVYISTFKACWDLSLVIGGVAKRCSGGGSWGNQRIWYGSYLKVNFRWGWKGCFYCGVERLLLLAKKISKFRGSMFPASSESSYIFLFQFSGLCSFPINAIIVTVNNLWAWERNLHCINSIIITILWYGYYYYPHFQKADLKLGEQWSLHPHPLSVLLSTTLYSLWENYNFFQIWASTIPLP